MREEQAVLIPGMIAPRRNADPLAKYKGQCRLCRECGGLEAMNENRLWSSDAPEICCCTKFDLCLEVDIWAGKMRLANGHGPIFCDGTQWSCC